MELRLRRDELFDISIDGIACHLRPRRDELFDIRIDGIACHLRQRRDACPDIGATLCMGHKHAISVK